MALTLALETYDRTQALIDGRVSIPGVEPVLVPSGPRHERMLLERAYDIAELSMSSYIMARAREVATQGFRATKWFLRRGPWDGPAGMRENEQVVRALRAERRIEVRPWPA